VEKSPKKKAPTRFWGLGCFYMVFSGVKTGNFSIPYPFT